MSAESEMRDAVQFAYNGTCGVLADLREAQRLGADVTVAIVAAEALRQRLVHLTSNIAAGEST